MIAAFVTLISIITLENNKNKYDKIASQYVPYISSLKEFESAIRESNKLIIDWVYIADKDEKDRLSVVQNSEIPFIKQKLQFIGTETFFQGMEKDLHDLISDYDNYSAIQKTIMRTLKTPENYASDKLVDESISILNNELAPRYKNISANLSKVLNNYTGLFEKADVEMKNSYNYLSGIMIVLLILIVAVTYIASRFSTQNISKPVNELKNVIVSLGKGEIPLVHNTERKDEIGQMTNAIAAMVENIKLKTEFATRTGKGIYNANFDLLGEKDILGLALIEMRNNLKKSSEEEFTRAWLTSGIARLNEILRDFQENEDQLYDTITAYIVNYLNVCQGGMFIVKNEIEREDKYLELVAGYAYKDKKNISTKLTWGEGLPGRVALDRKMLILSDIPEGYSKIVSGLGESSPKSLLIVPFVFENEVKGLIELASMREFTPIQVEFLENISDKIAITFDHIERKLKTEILLKESQELNEKLLTGKEELKNANEELSTFIYKSSHDLKGPLCSILGLLNVAHADIKDKKAIHYLDMINEMTTKVDDILKALIQTMDMKESNPNIEVINFENLIESTLNKFERNELFKRIDLKLNVENARPFYSDRQMLHSVLQNIIDNSIKYQNPAVLYPILAIDVTDYADGVKINITDNGSGIDKKVQLKVFDMFYRGNNDSKGAGLGLYIVKNVVRKLNGRIQLESEKDRGTKFTITLPNCA